MKPQSFQVRDLKNKIAACLRLIGLKVKSAVLRLIDLQEKLEEAMTEQIKPWIKEVSDSINEIMESRKSPNGAYDFIDCEKAARWVAEVIEKYGCGMDEDLIKLAFNSITRQKPSEYKFRQELDDQLRYIEWMKPSKGQEQAWADAEKQADASVDEDAEYQEYVRNLELSGQW